MTQKQEEQVYEKLKILYDCNTCWNVDEKSLEWSSSYILSILTDAQVAKRTAILCPSNESIDLSPNPTRTQTMRNGLCPWQYSKVPYLGDKYNTVR